jgi:hypothetical protein
MAEPQTYALVDGTDTIQNIVVWDGSAPWTPPAGQTPKLLADAVAGGATYANGGSFGPQPTSVTSGTVA